MRRAASTAPVAATTTMAPKVLTFFELVRRELAAEGRIPLHPASKPPPPPTTPPTPTTTATTTTTTPTTRATTRPAEPQAAMPVGLMTTSALGAVSVAGALGLMSAEVALASPMAADDRETTRAVGLVSAGVMFVGGAAAVGAGALWAIGVLE